MLDIKDTPELKRDSSGAVLSTNEDAYKRYMEAFSAKIQKDREINSRIENLESGMRNIQNMLTELLSRVA